MLYGEELWMLAVDAKYGNVGGWCSNGVQGTYGICLWKNIRKGWDSFCSLVAFKVGDGANIKFWFDTWCGRTPLKDVFPELFGIANNKESSVAKLLSSLGNGFNWNVNFVRPVQDWELESVVTFVDLIYSGLARENGVDQ